MLDLKIDASRKKLGARPKVYVLIEFLGEK